jgi:hypothetical protein
MKAALHCQKVPGWARQRLSEWGAGWVKIVNPVSGHDPFPGLRKVLRFWTDDWDKECIARGTAGAVEYMQRVLPMWRQFANWGDCIFELPNEPACNGNDEIARLVEFTLEATDIAHDNGFKVCAYNISVGNPHDNGTGDPSVTIWKMRQLAHGLVGADYWSYHAYWTPNKGGPANPAYALRYRQWLQCIRQEGITPPPLLLTEAGIDGGIEGRPYKSWRTLSNREAYARDVAQFEAEVRKDKEVQAYFLYTAGYENPWGDFEHDEETVTAIGAALRSLPEPEEEGMQIDGRRMTVDEFRRHVETLDIGPVNEVYIHHTVKPTQEQWANDATMRGMKAYYESLGWEAGPHLFVEKGGIWLFTPLSQDGIGVRGHNWRTRHIEIVGDYSEAVPSGETLDNALKATAILLRKTKTPLALLKMHREAQADTECPGDALAARWPWFKLQVGYLLDALNTAPNLPASEFTIDPAIIAQKTRWWLEEEQRQHEVGNTPRADAIRRSLIQLLYRLEALIETR